MPKPKMQLFIIDGKSLFRDENNADEEHFVRADHRERYDQETLRQKIAPSEQAKRAAGKGIMDADAKERELRGNIHEAIVGRQAGEHVDFHIAAMYRDETYRLSMKVARTRRTALLGKKRVPGGRSQRGSRETQHTPRNGHRPTRTDLRKSQNGQKSNRRTQLPRRRRL
jgi:hypothetical protein